MALKTKLLILAAVLLAATAGLILLGGLGEAGKASDLTAGFNAEFIQRPDGYPGLAKAYGLHFARPPRQMDSGLMYKACAQGAVDVICGFATDGRIAAYDLKPLLDDRKFFPPYYAAPLVRRQTLRKHPELGRALARLAGRIDDRTMRELNLQVDREADPRGPAAVARDFLVSAGLIAADARASDGADGTVRVGGKDFTEQSILGQMLAILVECSTRLRVERKLYLGGTMICFNALKAGDLDVYVEYTGTGLVNILQRPPVSDPDAAYATVKAEFDKRFGLVWLAPLGFNNTYTLTMRREQAERLGLRTISDLAARLGRLGLIAPPVGGRLGVALARRGLRPQPNWRSPILDLQ